MVNSVDCIILSMMPKYKNKENDTYLAADKWITVANEQILISVPKYNFQKILFGSISCTTNYVFEWRLKRNCYLLFQGTFILPKGKVCEKGWV